MTIERNGLWIPHQTAKSDVGELWLPDDPSYDNPYPDDPLDELVQDTCDGQQDEPVSTSAENYETVTYRRKIKAAGAVINYTFQVPVAGNGGSQLPTDQTPIIIGNGLGGVEYAYSKLRDTLSKSHGIPTATLRPARKQNPAQALHRNYRRNPFALPSRSIYGVMTDIAHNHDDVEDFDLALHSMGGLVGTKGVALRHPGMVRSVALMGSVGLEDQSLLKMLKRTPRFIREEWIPNAAEITDSYDPKVVYDSFHYSARGPLRTLRESIGVTGADIRPTLPMLGRAGINSFILNFDKDTLTLNRQPDEDVIESVDRSVVLQGGFGHLSPQLHSSEVADELVDFRERVYRLY